MWIFCGGMNRSGSTLQYQIVAEIVERKNMGKRIEWIQPETFNILVKKYKDYKKYKVFKSHICNEDIKSECNNNGKIVYIIRDLRDIVVSLMKKRNVDFEKVINTKKIDKGIENYYKWINFKDIYISYYENVILNLSIEVKNIAKFLNIEINDIDAEYIANYLSFENQKKTINNFQKDKLTNFNNSYFDKYSLLHCNHIVDGKIGKWKDELTTKEINIIENKYGGFLEEHKYIK